MLLRICLRGWNKNKMLAKSDGLPVSPVRSFTAAKCRFVQATDVKQVLEDGTIRCLLQRLFSSMIFKTKGGLKILFEGTGRCSGKHIILILSMKDKCGYVATLFHAQLIVISNSVHIFSIFSSERNGSNWPGLCCSNESRIEPTLQR